MMKVSIFNSTARKVKLLLSNSISRSTHFEEAVHEPTRLGSRQLQNGIQVIG